MYKTHGILTPKPVWPICVSHDNILYLPISIPQVLGESAQMTAPLTELAVIIALVLTNGLFAMAEMALVSARKSKLRTAAKEGDTKAQEALTLSETPTRFLSTIQIGISLIGTLAGAFGGASFAQTISKWIAKYPPLEPYSNAIALGLVVLFISYLSLVLGELVPKRLALNNPENIAAQMASPVKKLSVVVSPIVHILSISTESVLRILGQSNRYPSPISEEEIRLLIAESNETGILSASEINILDRVFQLGERRAWSVMQPRPEIIWLDIEDLAEENWQKILSTNYSQYPVCKGELDVILGTIHVRDLLESAHNHKELDLTQELQQPLIIPETKPALEILDMFKQSGIHMAMVVNEFGGIEGIVTLGDILEALVGYIFSQDQPEEPEAMQTADGSWIFDGMLPIDEFKKHLSLKSLPGEESGQYQTIGGFLMAQLGHIPTPKEKLQWAGFQFEILDMDKHRIDKILVTPTRE